MKQNKTLEKKISTRVKLVATLLLMIVKLLDQNLLALMARMPSCLIQ